MELSLFDLHCDTAYRMTVEHFPLWQNPFAVSLQQASVYRKYAQVMALWTPPHQADADGWSLVLEMIANLQRDPALQNGSAGLFPSTACHTAATRLYLSLEDARVLEERLDRIDLLYRLGVRILTPLWKGVSIIGGAHDTSIGLSDLGKQTVAHAIDLGMIPDISHASEASAEQIFEIADAHNFPVIASHSNAYALCPVSRNLRDGQIDAIVRANGLIGINLHEPFLCKDRAATLDDIVAHVEYICSRGASSVLALGCDMDGGEMPHEIPSVSHLAELADRLLQKNYSEELIRGIFFDHANGFFQRYVRL